MNTLERISIGGALLAGAGLVHLFWENALLARGAVGVAIQVASVGLFLWARVTFGWRSFRYRASPTPGGIVTTGPYAYLRHPIYAAILYFSAAGVVSNWSAPLVISGTAVAVGLCVRMACEERLLKAAYPAYSRYAARTKLIVPFVM